jgi:choline dehydrogenase-like flavoprotein
MTETFDFIVVGGSSANPSRRVSCHHLLTCVLGGTAGCLVAAKLASTESRPSVLLVEAGAEPVGDTLGSPYDRFTPVFTRPDLDHGYSTTAQSQLNGRVLPYARGKGLGGSSILNFMGKHTNDAVHCAHL